jgi:hypothetical protein
MVLTYGYHLVLRKIRGLDGRKDSNGRKARAQTLKFVVSLVPLSTVVRPTSPKWLKRLQTLESTLPEIISGFSFGPLIYHFRKGTK